MLNKVFTFILFSSISALVWAEDVSIRPDHPSRYVVEKGDTLWAISTQFLSEPWRWPEIWQANPQIENPHLIYPGDVISLSYVDGQPVLTLERGTAQEDVPYTKVVVGKEGGRDAKLSPRIRAYDDVSAIHTIPIDVIRHFLIQPILVSKREMRKWPYIVSNYEQHLIAGTDNKIYIKGLKEDALNQKYSIYRQGPAYKSVKKYRGKVLGYEALYIGDVTIERVGEPSTGIVTYANREILVGDRLLPQSQTDQDFDSHFIPRPPEDQVGGNILSVIDGVSQIGQYQVVVMDVGQVDKVESGNVLGIYQSGVVVPDKIAIARRKVFGRSVQLPEEFSGIVLIFRTFDKLSLGLVMEAYGPLHVHDAVKNL